MVYSAYVRWTVGWSVPGIHRADGPGAGTVYCLLFFTHTSCRLPVHLPRFALRCAALRVLLFTTAVVESLTVDVDGAVHLYVLHLFGVPVVFISSIPVTTSYYVCCTYIVQHICLTFICEPVVVICNDVAASLFVQEDYAPSISAIRYTFVCWV